METQIAEVKSMYEKRMVEIEAPTSSKLVPHLDHFEGNNIPNNSQKQMAPFMEAGNYVGDSSMYPALPSYSFLTMENGKPKMKDDNFDLSGEETLRL